MLVKFIGMTLPRGSIGMVAARILQDTAIGKNYASDKLSGARRLRDAIVLGYQLQRVPGRDISIPDWYANAENEFGLRTGSPTAEVNEDSFDMTLDTGDFEILHGDLMGLSDTISFLKSLAELDAENDSGKNMEKRQIRERIAAAGLFNWEEDIFVARAPGRLDVVGGIADYSGSLVLQMPIREACHVALQKVHPSKQRLWKHAQARQHDKGQGPTPVLQIVSYGSELSNRAPTFDMDLSDFMDGEKPMSYEKAKEFFAKDPSQRWAAYVAGTILVLMKELNIRFDSSISMLVSSAVPEGKGVSSSASVEVASMSAIAAAHGFNNDINVLNQYPLFNDVLQGHSPQVQFTVNDIQYTKGYYLADGIYPEWASFLKSFTYPEDPKRIKFKQMQEAARKDVERAFGVLQSPWAIVRDAARFWHKEALKDIMYACIILHNMIVKNEGNAISNWSDEEVDPPVPASQGFIQEFQQYLKRHAKLRD